MGGQDKNQQLPKPPAVVIPEAPTPIKPIGPHTVKGCDVSYAQGQVDWAAKKASGYEFAFCKASEGLTLVDKQFARNWVEAPKAGLMVGAYHFYRPTLDALTQAHHFCQTVGPKRPKDLPPMLDLEAGFLPESSPDFFKLVKANAEAIKKGALIWLEFVEKTYGKSPIFYSYPAYLECLGDLSQFERFPLNIANPGASKPHVFKPWPTWTFWQYSWKPFDQDLFNGPMEQLKKLTLG